MEKSCDHKKKRRKNQHIKKYKNNKNNIIIIKKHNNTKNLSKENPKQCVKLFPYENEEYIQ